MKTKIFLIGIIIFLANVISGFAKEQIKTCWWNWQNNKGFIHIAFPETGGKPYGTIVEQHLMFTNPLNLELQFIQVNSPKDCLNGMRTGEYNIMANLQDKDDRRNYMILVPYHKCDECPGNKQINLGISKKSKYASYANKFKSIELPSSDYITSIRNTNYIQSYQHSWNQKDQNILKICQFETSGRGSGWHFKWNLNEKYPFGGIVEIGNYYAKLLGERPIYFENHFSALAVESGFCDISFVWSKKWLDPNYKTNIIDGKKINYKNLDLFKLTEINKENIFALVNKDSFLLDDLKKIGPISTNLNYTITYTKWENYNQHDWHGYKNTCGKTTYYGLEQTMMGVYSSVSNIKNTDKCEDDLSIAYRLYAQIKECNKSRKGYAMVYVNDVEMKKAKDLVKNVETAIVKKNPSLSNRKDFIWKRETGDFFMDGKIPVGVVKPPSQPYDENMKNICMGAVMGFSDFSKQYLGSGSDKDF